MQIITGATNLSNLFSEKGTKTVSVPSFQRNYSWTGIQVDKFLEDVYTSAKNEEPHFWGPIVVLRDPQNATELEVIDGQQRISTAMIFLSLLRDQAAKLTDHIMLEGEDGEYDVIPMVRNFLFRAPKYNETKFSGSYLIDAVLQKYIFANPKGRPKLTVRGAQMSAAMKKQTKELRAAYLKMSQNLEEKLGKLPDKDKKVFISEVFTALTENFEIHTMELSSEDDAYILFESLNDRGLRLNPSDLLKTFTLREVRNNSDGTKREKAIESALDDWDTTVENLGDYDFTKFLRHYMLTLSADKVQTGKIFGEFKKRIKKLGKFGAHKNLKELKRASENYAQLLGDPEHADEDLKEGFDRMNRYSDTHRVFLLGMLDCELSTELQRLLTRAVEYMSFRWIAAGKNAQELETIYQTEIRRLLADPTEKNARTIADSLIEAAPKDAVLTELTRSESTELQRYILRRIEVSTGGDIVTTPHVEHLAPQNPAEGDDYWYEAVAKAEKEENENEDVAVYQDFVSNWGNLTLLEGALNASIKNSQWPKKIAGGENYKGISASNYNINKAIVSKAEWTATDILQREKWIKQCISALVSEKWVKSGKSTIEMWDGN